MGRGWSFLALLVVALGLGAYIYLVESRRDPAPGERRDKVFGVEGDAIEEITITAESGEITTLRKIDGNWQIVAPVQTEADRTEVSGVTRNLSDLEIQRVVAEEADDLEAFGLDSPRVAVAFRTASDGDLRRLLIGDRTPTGSDLYARVEGDSRVILIPSYLDSTFNRTAFDLRDKAALKFDRDAVDALALTSADGAVELAKRDTEWQMVRPWQARGDYGTAEAVISRLSTAQMTAIIAAEETNLRQYGLDRPAVTVRVGAGSAQATLAVGGEAEDGTRYARDLARPLVFTVDASLVDELTKPAGDFRRKDLFEFRPFNTTRLEITREGGTTVFEKVSTGDEDEKWRLIAPDEADLDASRFDSALWSLSSLRADSFVETRAGTGLDAPAVTVAIRYDEGKKEERVVFGRSGGKLYAAREDEAGAAVLEASALDDALKSLDEARTAATEAGADSLE